jgi:hypothetical protein
VCRYEDQRLNRLHGKEATLPAYARSFLQFSKRLTRLIKRENVVYVGIGLTHIR